MHLIFDIGANIGNTVEQFSRKATQVIAFEPNPSLVAELRTRFPQKNIQIEEIALSDKEGSAIFHLSPSHTISTLSSEWVGESRFSHTHRWNQDISVRTSTLDLMIDKWGTPDYIKIDVEGHEEHVISGLTRLLPQTILSFEWAEEMKESIRRTLLRLESLGYTQYHWSNGDHILYDEEIEWTQDPWGYWQTLEPNRKTDWGMIYVKA
jgi:FkbM family methyltransferase